MDGCWLYIVTCADGSYYVGTTGYDDPAKQVVDHNSRASSIVATAHRRPVKLAFAAHFDGANEAEALQRSIENWGDDRLSDLIAGRCEDILIAATA